MIYSSVIKSERVYYPTPILYTKGKKGAMDDCEHAVNIETGIQRKSIPAGSAAE
jgi:hypothetical protein